MAVFCIALGVVGTQDLLVVSSLKKRNDKKLGSLDQLQTFLVFCVGATKIVQILYVYSVLAFQFDCQFDPLIAKFIVQKVLVHFFDYLFRICHFSFQAFVLISNFV